MWAAVSLLGVARLQIDSDTSAFLDRSSEEWGLYQRAVGLFGRDDFVTLALASEEPFEESILTDLVSLTGDLQRIEGVGRVDSLSSTPIAWRSGDLVLFEPLLSRETATTPGALLRRIGQAGVDVSNLASKDRKLVAVNVRINSDAAEKEVVNSILQLADRYNARVSGVPVFRFDVTARTLRELTTLTPIVLSLLALVVLLAYRSFLLLAMWFSCSVVTVVILLGSMGFIGTPLSLSTMPLPPILLALSTAYVMHILSAFTSYAGNVDERIFEVGGPLLLSAATTIGGFLGMYVVPISAVRELSFFGGMGTALAVSTALSLCPAVGHAAGGRSATRKPRAPGWLFVGWRFESRAVLFAWLVSGLVVVGGVGALRVSTDIIRWFPTGERVRDDYEAIRSSFSGITPLSIVVETHERNGIVDRGILTALSRLEEHLEAMPEVGSAVSIAEIVQRVARVLGDGGTADASDHALEQYFLVLSGIPGVSSYMSGDRKMANVHLRLDTNDSQAIARVARSAEHWWRTHGVGDTGIWATGIMFEFARSEDAIARGQIAGLLAAVLAILAVLAVTMRSIPVAAMVALVNVLPLVLIYGIMGLLRIPLDAATVCVGSVAMGIAVDDGVHLVMSYDRERAVSGRSSPGVARETVLVLTLTTVAIVIGFGSLALSGFGLIRNFGVLVAVTCALCLVANLTLLPGTLRALPARILRDAS